MPPPGGTPVPEYTASVDIAAPPDVVFRYLTTPEGMTAWMGQHARLEPVAGGAFEVDIAGSAIRGEYVEVVPPHRVVVSWGVAGSEELPPGSSSVTFSLVATPDGTRVDLHHRGLPDVLLAGHADGWQHFMPRLADAAVGIDLGADDWVPLDPRRP